MSYTSQLAHITSSAYVKSPTAQEHLGFSAGSFKDMTRVARLDPAMWTRLFSLNRDYLLPEIKTLIANLTAYADALESGDDGELRRLLEDGLNKKLTAGGI
ncbi:MAG: prephenate dehydrogenase/arogenate dehydrogenase family protein, partial [Clostridia bacterium]|nr:prephenate dehydrogenase/arogenate dehydrogenase family protein [Clostridia bacterium]